MSRSILKRTSALAVATVASGALVLGTPGLAQAANYDRGQSDADRTQVDGSGDADARAKANNDGRFRLFTEADGGNGPIIGGDQETRATANAHLSKRISVADGTYRVVVTYQGLKGTERDRGADSSAQVTRRSAAVFTPQGGDGDGARVQRIQQVESSQGTRRTVLEIKVPDDSSGFLRVSAHLSAVSSATGDASNAKAVGRTSDVSFKVNRR